MREKNTSYNELKEKVSELELSMARFNRTNSDGEQLDENIEIAQLLKLDEVKEIMELFFTATNLGVGLMDSKYQLLANAGWQNICTHFHEKHPVSNKSCLESRGFFKQNMQKGVPVEYKCKNGLWDIAYPLFYDDTFIGSIYFGQFFYKSDAINKDHFVGQAKQFNFDVDDYLNQLRQIPIFEKENVVNYVNLFMAMVEKLSKIGDRTFIQIK